MKYSRLFRSIWFRSDIERCWFKEQCSQYYSKFRKSIVLYGLRRLSLIFRMPLISFDGKVALSDLFDAFSKTSRNSWCSVLLPKELVRNPLQIILDDYTCAEELLIEPRAVSPISENWTVSDYVRFVAEFDVASMRQDGTRVSVSLGVLPPGSKLKML